MTREIPETFISSAGIHRDWVDKRDQPYQPNLSILRDEMRFDHRLLSHVGHAGLAAPIFGVRDQKQTHRCVGYALAALIDIQRNMQWLHGPDGKERLDRDNLVLRSNVVSADMLYRMAHFHENHATSGGSAAVEGIRSLRSAIKGFYHHGACLDWPSDTPCADPGRWQSTCYHASSTDVDQLYPSVAQAKSARSINLGAYFRLAPVLNHYHAALNEAHAVLVATQIHGGWRAPMTPGVGTIMWPPDRTDSMFGCHAVVLTGYDAKGFHVLNSWGPHWGGHLGQAGIALWKYADWAQNIVDAWVLRLGVPTPSAFDQSIGEQGISAILGPIRAGSTPCFELVGHYMHLDDGNHVSTGAYPSFPDSWGKTHAYLSETLTTRPEVQASAVTRPKTDLELGPDMGTPYRGVLLWIPGSFEDIKSAFDRATARKQQIKQLGLYPYTLFWCNSFVDALLEVLDHLFAGCQARIGDPASPITDRSLTQLNLMIESAVRGVGRAFWREMETSAHQAIYRHAQTSAPTGATKPLGPVGQLFRDLIRLRAQTGCELHLVAEGAGALVLHELLDWLATESGSDGEMAQHLDTMHLIHPAISLARANSRITPCLMAMNGTDGGKTLRPSRSVHPTVTPRVKTARPPRARVYVPAPALESDLYFRAYGRSLLTLAAKSFDATAAETTATDGFLGTADIAGHPGFAAQSALFQLNTVQGRSAANSRVSQAQLMRDPTITTALVDAIRHWRSPQDPQIGDH